MISSETLEMSRHGSRDLLRLLHLKKMTDDLGVMGRLPGQALNGISLRENLGFGHDLNLLRRLRGTLKCAWFGRDGAVYELRFGIESVVKQSL